MAWPRPRCRRPVCSRTSSRPTRRYPGRRPRWSLRSSGHRLRRHAKDIHEAKRGHAECAGSVLVTTSFVTGLPVGYLKSAGRSRRRNPQQLNREAGDVGAQEFDEGESRHAAGSTAEDAARSPAVRHVLAPVRNRPSRGHSEMLRATFDDEARGRRGEPGRLMGPAARLARGRPWDDVTELINVNCSMWDSPGVWRISKLTA